MYALSPRFALLASLVYLVAVSKAPSANAIVLEPRCTRSSDPMDSRHKERQLNWSMARSVLQLSGLLARRSEQYEQHETYWARQEHQHSTLIHNKEGEPYVVSTHRQSRSLARPNSPAAMARALSADNVQNGTIKVMNGTTIYGYLCKDEANRMEVCVNGTSLSVVPTNFTSQSATPSNSSDVALQMEGDRCITYDPGATSYLYSSECSWGGNQTFRFESANSRLQPIPQLPVNSTGVPSSQIDSRDAPSGDSGSVMLIFEPEAQHLKPKESNPDAPSTTVLTMTATTTLTITSTATATSTSDVTAQAITAVSASSPEVSSSASSSPSTSASDATVSPSSIAALEIEMITPVSQMTMSSTGPVSSSTTLASFTNPSDNDATSSASASTISSSVAPSMSSASAMAPTSSSVATSSVVSAAPSMMVATFPGRNQHMFKAESM